MGRKREKKDDFRDATEKSGMQVGAEAGCDNKKGNRCEEIWGVRQLNR